MDVLYFVKQRLSFIDRLYDTATEPFREVKRKIEAGEQPFVDCRDPECHDVSEPAYLEEWQDADTSVEVIGQWCLNMVYASLKSFLEEYVSEIGCYFNGGAEAVRAEFVKTKAVNWFERYRVFFRDSFHIDWEKSPVKLADIEHINLTRDDLVHNVTVNTNAIYQTKKHADRHPKGIFVDEGYVLLGLGGRIRVGREELTVALGNIDTFCTWLEEHRNGYFEYLRSLERD